MATDKRVISQSNFPTNIVRLIWPGLVMYLCLDRWQAPVWICSVLWTLFGLAALAS